MILKKMVIKFFSIQMEKPGAGVRTGIDYSASVTSIDNCRLAISSNQVTKNSVTCIGNCKLALFSNQVT